MTQEQIDKAIRRYNKLASRRDERINRPALDEIAAQLAQVPPGTRPDVDRLLGRPGAVMPERVEYNHMHQCGWCGEWYIGARVDHGCPAPEPIRPSTDTTAATEAVAELAQHKMSEFEAHMRMLCADTEPEAPDYPGMWK